MATVVNTMYPPQIGGSGTFMPAFVVDENGAGEVAVKFSLSPYNDTSSIKGVHVTCVYMDSNMNALDAPTGVYYVDFESVVRPTLSKGEYEIRLYFPKASIDGTTSASYPGKALMKSGFVTGKYYKVQLRFDCNEDKNLPASIQGQEGGNLDSEYLSNNTDYFTEWSSVCLVRPIGTPAVSFSGLFNRNVTDVPEDESVVFNRGIIQLTGSVSFSPEGEQIESYKVTVVSKSTGETMTSTEDIYPTNPNQFDYRLDTEGYSASAGSEFSIRLSFVTENQYKFESQDCDFELGEFSRNDYFRPEISVENLPDNGAVRVTVENTNSISGVLLIRRASSVDDYHDWETINAVLVSGPISYSFEDMTVCSGVIYRYSATLETVEGSVTEDGDFKVTQRFYTKAYKSVKVIPDFYDAMFYRLGKQMAVRYNFSISSYKPVVNRTKVDTLGGKYPRFVENANLGYKQFSITGLISSQEDPDTKFLSRAEFYEDHLGDIQKYNSNNEIRKAYDFFWEREFREELLKWLNDGEPKLMRTMTEGNICVMLTDISLTPNTTLGRRLYTFTATAYEVEKGTDLSTLISLGIHETGLDDAEAKFGETVSDGVSLTKVEKIGQLYQQVPKFEKQEGDTYIVSSDVVDMVYDSIKKRFASGGVYKGHSIGDGSLLLHDVKITFHSNPHIYRMKYTKEVNRDTDLVNHNFEHPENDIEQILSGYKLAINGGADIFVNIGRYYQIPSIIKVKSLAFPSVREADEDEWDTVTVDYVVSYDDLFDKSKADDSSTEGMSSDKTVYGQVSGIFQPGEILGDRVYNKYVFQEEQIRNGQRYNVIKKMNYWKGISIETDPYAVCMIQFEDDYTYTEFTVGESGIFNIQQNVPCEDMYFKGVKIFRHRGSQDPNPSPDGTPDNDKSIYGKDVLGPNEFFYGATYKYKNEAKPGRVYSFDDGTMKFYSLDKEWYDFTPVPETLPYTNTGSSVIHYKPNRNPQAGIISKPVSCLLNYTGTIMKKWERVEDKGSSGV